MTGAAPIRGRAWKFGDDVNTDVIMPGSYLSLQDPSQIASHIMEGLDPEFGRKAQPGDIIVAGKNFGCGSSRETAPGGLRAFGIGCVIAPTFARIFLRNAINIGLPVLECTEAAREIAEGHTVSVDFARGLITDETSRATYRAAAFPPFLQEMIAAGGLVAYTRARLGPT